MRIYLAAKYRWRMVVKLYADRLEQQGHIVTSRWVYGVHDSPAPENRARYAQEDLADVGESEVLALFQLPVDEPEQSSGRQIEFGYALALNKRVAIVGARTSVFHHVEKVVHYPTTEDFFAAYAKEV